MNHVDGSAVQRVAGRKPRRTLHLLFTVVAAALLLAGCGNDEPTPTRTPFPTWTPTPIGGVAPTPAVAEQAAPAPAAGGEATPVQDQPAAEAPPVVADTPTPQPTDTPVVAETPTAAPSDTPTATLEPTPTPTAAFAFSLETAEKFPTDSLASGVVRIYLYVYSEQELGLGGYSLQVSHNGEPRVVDEVSTAGAPDVTRTDPSPYTRFTNMNVIFVETQAGRWEIQLVDAAGRPVGPPAVFDLTADEITRELYVRYRQE